MKLVLLVVVSLAALSWADSSYSNYQNNHKSYYEPSVSADEWNEYYQNGVGAGSNRRQSLFDTVSSIFLPNRRQFGLGGVGGPIDLIVPVVIVIVIAGVALVGVLLTMRVANTTAHQGVVTLPLSPATSLTSSGRGLYSDAWEVDYSVWINQLQKDFEDSWTTE